MPGAPEPAPTSHLPCTSRGIRSSSRSEKDDDGGHARRQKPDAAAAPATDGTGDAVPGKTEGVKAGYKGRARRGKEKAGGYDLTPNRRGPRKVKGARIRYVEEDERGGGTTEQKAYGWDQ